MCLFFCTRVFVCEQATLGARVRRPAPTPRKNFLQSVCVVHCCVFPLGRQVHRRPSTAVFVWDCSRAATVLGAQFRVLRSNPGACNVPAPRPLVFVCYACGACSLASPNVYLCCVLHPCSLGIGLLAPSAFGIVKTVCVESMARMVSWTNAGEGHKLAVL